MATSTSGLPSCLAGRTQLLANMHFPLATMADPEFAGDLRERYISVSQSLAPQVIEHVKKVTGDTVNVAALTFVGSASAFRSFRDIDINVIYRGDQIGLEREKLTFTFPMGRQGAYTRKTGLYYVSLSEADSSDYVRFMYGKPVIWGKVPKLHGAELPGALSGAVKASLYHADNFLLMLGRGTSDTMRMMVLRYALHSEVNAARYLQAKWKLAHRKQPTLFNGLIQRMHSMDNNMAYDEGAIRRIRVVLGEWKSGKTTSGNPRVR